MDRKTILVDELAFGFFGLSALGVWLFKPSGSLRRTPYIEPYLPAVQISLTHVDWKFLSQEF